MKILHVIPSVSPLRGGPSFAMRSIAGGLAAAGIETHVATTNDNAAAGTLSVRLGEPVEENGVKYWYFPRQSSIYLYSVPFSGWMWRHASNYSLIHIHALFSYCSNMAAYIASRLGVPYVIRPLGVLNRWGMEMRRPRLKRMSFAMIERPLLERAAFVHYTSGQERLEAARCGFKHRSVIVPNPVEIPQSAHRTGPILRERFPEIKNRRIILFLSRIDRKKGLDLLIPAFAGLIREMPDAVLVIAGDGDEMLERALREQCRALGIGNSVYWPGFLSGAAKWAALAEADMFVLPSWSENFGIAAIEAMALGIPVIVTDQVGICREVEANNAGVVIPTGIEALRAAMVCLLSDAQQRAIIGRNAAALVQSQFAPPVVTGKLLSAYRTVLASS